MIPHLHPEEQIRLILDWAAAQPPPRRLAVWAILAIALHAGAWFVFRAVEPSVSLLEPSTASIHVVNPHSPEARTLARWLAANSPDLFSPTRDRGSASATPEPASFQASFEITERKLRPLPAKTPGILPPLPGEPSPVPVFDATPVTAPAPPIATATEIRTGSALRARIADRRLQGSFEARRGDQLEPSEFMVAVSPEGKVLHVVEIKTTGFAPLNDEARMAVMALEFLPDSSANLVWDVVTIHWGLDVERSNRK